MVVGTVMQTVKSQTAGRIDALLCQWAGSACIAATFLAMAAWTWRKWPDILVDFGRELYVPWQLVTGKVLYTDIAYFNGPFSPYLNALWFHIFGVSFTTLILANLAILAIITWMIYKTFSAACDRFTATMSSLVFLCVFAFSQYGEIGNYNFVSPYSHELTHGVGLTVGMIFLLSRSAQRRQLYMSFVAGLLLGLVFLTKAEVFLAAVAAGGLGIALLHISVKPSRQRTAMAALSFVGAALLPIALFFVFLSMQMPAAQALWGIAGTWTALLGSKVASDLFYQWSTGLNQPWTHLAIIIRIFVGIMLIAGALAIADIARKLQKGRKIPMIGISVLLFGAAMLAKQSPELQLGMPWLPMPWLLIGWPLPVFILAAGAVITAAFVRWRAEHEMIARLAPIAMWAAFAFVLLGKIILHPRLYHYGFALAMPATLVLVVCFVWLVPLALSRLYGGGDLFRRFAAVMVIADFMLYLVISNIFYSHKYFVVGSNRDAIVTHGPRMHRIHPRGVVFAEALQRIEAVIPPEATFVVLPEGVMLNYLSRRVNPTPYLNFMPPELAIFGETTILDSFKARPPDFILLVHRDTSEYGVKYFGADPTYGQQIMDWVDNHYRVVERILDEPPKDERFGIKILQRRIVDDAAPVASANRYPL
jgi:hypothetical protein